MNLDNENRATYRTEISGPRWQVRQIREAVHSFCFERHIPWVQPEEEKGLLRSTLFLVIEGPAADIIELSEWFDALKTELSARAQML